MSKSDSQNNNFMGGLSSQAARDVLPGGMTECRAFTRTFAAAVLCASLAAAAAGNYLVPAPLDSFVPMRWTNMIRIEKVLQAHHRELDGCLAFVGDSRIAFHVEAARFPRDCPAGNYAFPGLNSETTLAVTKRLKRAETVVLGMTEGLFLKPARPHLELVMSSDLIRMAYVGHQRLMRWADSLSGVFPLSDGWSWDGKNGRWSWQGVNERVFVEKPTKDAETRAMAVSYFKTDGVPANIERLTGELLRRVSHHAERLVVVIPPALPAFISTAEEVAPGEFARYRDAVVKSATSAGHRIIECRQLSACGLDATDFADPVHLNARGATIWTEFLAREIAR